MKKTMCLSHNCIVCGEKPATIGFFPLTENQKIFFKTPLDRIVQYAMCEKHLRDLRGENPSGIPNGKPLEDAIKKAVANYDWKSEEAARKAKLKEISDCVERAMCFFQSDKLQEASNLYEEAIRLHKDEHSDSGCYAMDAMEPCYSALGVIFTKQKYYARAEIELRKALEIRERLNHPDLAETLLVLAKVLNAQQKIEDAEMMCRRSLEIKEKALGKNNPDLVEVLTELSGIYAILRRFGDSKQCSDRALKLEVRTSGK
jgi:tetratricopeptide (TPR) repeat protein